VMCSSNRQMNICSELKNIHASVPLKDSCLRTEITPLRNETV
jgi:hypothetical protein